MTARPYTDALGDGACRAMPSARAGRPAARTNLRCFGDTATIAIANSASLPKGDRAVANRRRARTREKSGTFFDALCIAVPTFAASWFAAALLSGLGR